MQRFKVGDRVQAVGLGALMFSSVPLGSTGTVGEVAGFGGKSVYPDPCKRMVFVKWDDRMPKGVGRNEVRLIKGSA